MKKEMEKTSLKAGIDAVREKLIHTEKGTLRQSIQNCVTVLEEDPLLKDAIKRNELTGQINIVKDLGWKRRCPALTDTDFNQIRLYMEKNYDLISEKKIKAAIDIVSSENSYHPIRECLESLEWDGKERIRYLMPRYLGAEESDYTYEATRLMMLGAINRVFTPGCKFEYMVCLVGGQGAGKSTFFRFMAIKDEWFSDDLRKLEDDNVYRKMQGHWFIEMAEMLATSSAKSIEEIKSFVSRQKETYKIPYETHPEDRPRQCVFVGTSNNMNFMPFDRTGNRRFIPIAIDQEKAEHHPLDDEKECREYIMQCWAEAMTMYRCGNNRLTFSKEMADTLISMQKEFMPEDTKVGIIQAWLDGYEGDYVCSRMIYVEAFNRLDEPNTKELKDICSIMNESMPDWKQISSHRFKTYGTQRAWQRINCKQNEESGFMKVPDDVKLPWDL